MGLVEKLDAASKRLEELKASSVPGRWGASESPNSGSVIIWVTDGEGPFTWIFEDLEGGQHADLIIALHRTLDAQLAILKRTAEIIRARVSIGLHDHSVYGREFALADAILGGA